MKNVRTAKSSRALHAVAAFWVGLALVLAARPARGAATVDSLILSNSPTAYWHLNESQGATVALDSVGTFNAAYGTSATLGNAGPQSPAFPGFSATNTAVGTIYGDPNSVVTVPPLNLNTNTVTILAWINPYGSQDPYATLLGWRDSAGADYGLLAYGGQLGWVWSNYGWWETTGLTIPTNQWSLAVLVVTPTEGKVYLGASGRLSTYVSPNANPAGAYDTPCNIGGEPDGSRVFNGYMDEVAIFSHALTADQVQAIYAAGVGQVPVSITQQPLSRTNYTGGTARFDVVAAGTDATFQWKKGSAVLVNGGNISGARTPNLTIANVSASDAAGYSCVVSNSLGSVPSDAAALAVIAAPTTAYDAAVLGYRPLAYWQFNEAQGAATAVDYWGGFDGTPLPAAMLGVNGPQPPDFPGFASGNTALQTTVGIGNSSVAVPALNLNANTATVLMWIYPMGGQAAFTSMFANRTGGYDALNYNDDGATLSYQWDSYGWNSGLLIPSDQWSLVGLVIAPTNTTVYLGTGGVLTNSTQVIDNPILSFAGTSYIGSDSGNDTRVFNGVIDDVAFFNRSLSTADMAVIYGAALGQAPPPTTLNCSVTPSGLVLDWYGPWTLKQADFVTGPWSTADGVVPGAPIPMNAAKRFYRLQH
jgi:hypothetical protein